MFDQVDKHPLSCPDGLLQVLYNMSIPWFVNLTKVLASKYEHHYREFCRQDTQVIYSVSSHIVSHPLFLKRRQLLFSCDLSIAG